MTSRNLLLSVVILGCATASFFAMTDSSPSAQRRDLAKELAAFVATELAKSAEKGGTLLLIPPEDERDPFPSTLGKRLTEKLKDAGFSPVDVVTLTYTAAMESSDEPVKRADFLAALHGHPQARCVVSLVGIPRLSEAELPARDRPRIVVASTVLMPYLPSLPRGMVDLAIEVKRNAATDTRSSPELGELGRYFVLTRFPR